MSRVIWAKEEIDALAIWLVARDHSSDERGLFLSAQKAQRQVLPPHRWRSLPNNSSVLRLRVAMAEIEAKTVAHEHDIAISIDQPKLAPDLPLIEDMPPPATMEALDGLARLVGLRMAKTLMQALREEVQAQLAELANTMIEDWANETIRPLVKQKQVNKNLPRVFVYGLRRDVGDRVQQQMAGVCSIRHSESERPYQLRAAVEWAISKSDGVVCMMVDFIGHSDTDLIKNFARARVRQNQVMHVGGTETALVMTLEQRYKEPAQ